MSARKENGEVHDAEKKGYGGPSRYGRPRTMKLK